jgi:DNA-binding CsgD family transcriptional regulator
VQGLSRPGLYPPPEQVAQRLLAGWRSLSVREAEVSAQILVGRTQKEIADASGLGVSSVVTYRQRAYRKLGVARRRDLIRLYDGLVAGSGAGPPH